MLPRSLVEGTYGTVAASMDQVLPPRHAARSPNQSTRNRRRFQIAQQEGEGEFVRRRWRVSGGTKTTHQQVCGARSKSNLPIVDTSFFQKVPQNPNESIWS